MQQPASSIEKNMRGRGLPTYPLRKPAFTTEALPTFQGIENEDSLLFVLVLSPKEGARARNRLGRRFDYEHEHHFIEHEHEKCE